MSRGPSASPGVRPEASPFRLFQAINGFHLTEGIRAAIELDFFTAIAAGHGLFGIAVLRANPSAKVTAVDWKNVLEVARENALQFGVKERYTALAGSIFDVEIGSGYDLALIPNFLHHFDVATNEKLLRKLHAALLPGGRVATLEFVPNEDRVSPPLSAAFALIRLAMTPSGDAYTQAELEAMMRNAGFTRHEFHPLPPSPHSVLISRRD